MREIKFRGYSKSLQKFIYGGISIFEDEATIFDVNDMTNSAIEVELDSIGQFTGLKDQKGNDIYEGDILELNNCGLLIVCFYKGEFKLQKLAEYHKKINLYASISYLEFSVLRGNIYENPNLLQ